MRKIYKYHLAIETYQEIEIPIDAKLLSVQMQHGNPMLWALVWDFKDKPKEMRSIWIYGTGHEISENPGEYISTFQMAGGNLVFHAFDGGIIPF